MSNNVVFGSGDEIEGLLSPISTLYDFSHAAVQLGNLMLGDVISLLFRRSDGCEGGGGRMNEDLLYV